jgi:hypothetical protein
MKLTKNQLLQEMCTMPTPEKFGVNGGVSRAVAQKDQRILLELEVFSCLSLIVHFVPPQFTILHIAVK